MDGSERATEAAERARLRAARKAGCAACLKWERAKGHAGICRHYPPGLQAQRVRTLEHEWCAYWVDGRPADGA